MLPVSVLVALELPLIGGCIALGGIVRRERATRARADEARRLRARFAADQIDVDEYALRMASLTTDDRWDH
jgi:hypothetical protein